MEQNTIQLPKMSKSENTLNMPSNNKHNHLFPIFLKLEELQLLIVGGGTIGLEKLNAVLKNSPMTPVKMVAKEFTPEIFEKAECHSNINLVQKPYDSTDLEEADLVIAAVRDIPLSEKIRNDAKDFGLLINAADKPSLCDFYLGSVVQKGQLKIAISTNGKSPTIAKRVKDVLNDSFPEEINETLDNLTRVRSYLTGDFTNKVKKLNQITSVLSEKDFEKDVFRSRLLQFIYILSYPAILITGYIIGINFSTDHFVNIWFAVLSNLDATILIFIMAGFLAQLIDGALGMAYGITATSVLLSFGLSPIHASSSVHASEVVTSGVSGLSHLKFGNVEKKLFKSLLIPGVLGAIVGAFLLSSLEQYNHVIKPLVSIYTLLLGVIIIFKALRKDSIRKKLTKMFPLAFSGGFLDAIGGGGWGPIVSSTLMAQGKTPRYTIGSVNLAEFFVALASSITFFAMVGVNHWMIIFGLIIGGSIAAPFGAFLTHKIPARAIMILVGIVVIILSVKRIFF